MVHTRRNANVSRGRTLVTSVTRRETPASLRRSIMALVPRRERERPPLLAEELLDLAIELSFPASDPISVVQAYEQANTAGGGQKPIGERVSPSAEARRRQRR